MNTIGYAGVMNTNTPSWATGSATYAAYLAAAERCAAAFAAPARSDRRHYIDNVDELVFPAAREAYNGRLSNNQCNTIRRMIMHANPYVTDDGRVRGGTITTGLDRFDAADFREAVKTGVQAGLHRTR